MRYLLIASLIGLAACSAGEEPTPTPTPAPATLGSATDSTDSATAPSTTMGPDTDPPAQSTSTSVALAPLLGFELVEVTSVGFPVDFATTDGDGRLFVVDKTGVVVAVDGDTSDVFIDLTGEVSGGLEQGLLGMVFTPDYAESGRFLVSYTDRSGDTVIAEYVNAEGAVTHVRDLFTVEQPASNHNGGSMVFDETGLLYVGLGDGGGANDRFGNGQNTSSVLGSILRFDLDTGGPAAGNPFTDGGGAPEIWATGVRNPWRLSIDDDHLIVPDVGQNSYEEISLVSLEDRAPNLGWPRFEGLHCFDTSAGCDDAGLVIPVVEIPHGDRGTCSITGGVVYHGASIPEWQGRYFYSDFCGGYLRSVTFVDGEAVDHVDWTDDVGGSPGQVVVVGTGPDGELHIGTSNGRVFRVEPIR